MPCVAHSTLFCSNNVSAMDFWSLRNWRFWISLGLTSRVNIILRFYLFSVPFSPLMVFSSFSWELSWCCCRHRGCWYRRAAHFYLFWGGWLPQKSRYLRDYCSCCLLQRSLQC